MSITNGGYEPKELFILIGTEVEWTNTDVKKHWPASNNHPTHTLYPDSGIKKCGAAEAEPIFDACHGLAEGESWAFTFKKVGVWNYHDHLFPSLGGTVHVFENEDERAAAEAKAQTPEPSWFERFLRYLGSWFRGVKKFFGLLPPLDMPGPDAFRTLSIGDREAAMTRLSEYDAEQGWQYLKDVAFQDEEQVMDAHEMSHIVGNALYRERGFEGIGVCDPTFAFGCYHGVAEKFLEDKGPDETAGAAQTCKKIFPEESQFQQYSSCVHGLGHGLLAWHALDLSEALRSCTAVPADVQNHCFDGVFMEFSFSASAEQYPTADPWALCRDLGTEYHIACARYQPELMRSILGWDPKEIAQGCLTASTPQMQEHCVSKVGFEAAWEHKENAEKAVSSCSALFSGLARSQCITAAAKEFVFQQFPDWRAKSTELCDALSGSEKGTCTAARELTIEQYGR